MAQAKSSQDFSYLQVELCLLLLTPHLGPKGIFLEFCLSHVKDATLLLLRPQIMNGSEGCGVGWRLLYWFKSLNESYHGNGRFFALQHHPRLGYSFLACLLFPSSCFPELCLLPSPSLSSFHGLSHLLPPPPQRVTLSSCVFVHLTS